MNRIVGFELTNKGSWTILFMLIMNKQHSLIPKGPTIISMHSDFRYGEQFPVDAATSSTCTTSRLDTSTR